MEVYLRHDPAAAPLPLVLDSPHSGTHYPADFAHLPPRAVVRRPRTRMSKRCSPARPMPGATLVEALFPRAYIDPNRHPSDIDPAVAGRTVAGTRRALAQDRGSASDSSGGWRKAACRCMARPLSVADVERRIALYYEPYHAAVAAALDERYRRFGVVWHLNCHSMPAVGDVMSDDPGRERAEFVLGDRDGTTCEPEFTAFVAATLSAMGYEVAINDPYKASSWCARHGRPAERRHSLQIEINRRLYMDEVSLARTAGFGALQADLVRLIEALADYVRARA